MNIILPLAIGIMTAVVLWQERTIGRQAVLLDAAGDARDDMAAALALYGRHAINCLEHDPIAIVYNPLACDCYLSRIGR